MLKRNNTSGFTGVSWNKAAKKWHARIKRNGKNVNLGLYTTPEEASQIYLNAKNNAHYA